MQEGALFKINGQSGVYVYKGGKFVYLDLLYIADQQAKKNGTTWQQEFAKLENQLPSGIETYPDVQAATKAAGYVQNGGSGMYDPNQPNGIPAEIWGGAPQDAAGVLAGLQNAGVQVGGQAGDQATIQGQNSGQSIIEPPVNSAPGSTQAPSQEGLPPEMQELYTQLETYLKELEKRGQVLNPNIEITPELAAQFLKQAETEINPYFQTQLKLAREALYTGLGYAKDQILRAEQQLEQQYGRALKGVGESAAERGFAQSGIRQGEEIDLAKDTQQTIDQGRRQLDFQANQAAQGFAQQFGAKDLPTLNLGAAPTVGAGQYGFNRGQGERSLYQLSPEIYDSLVGEQEFNRRGAVKARASELEGAYRTGQAINQQRQLTL